MEKRGILISMVWGLGFPLSDAGPSFQATRANTWLMLISVEFQVCANNFSKKALLFFPVVLEADYTVILAVNIFWKIDLLQQGK